MSLLNTEAHILRGVTEFGGAGSSGKVTCSFEKCFETRKEMARSGDVTGGQGGDGQKND